MQAPRVKHGHDVARTPAGRIRLGGRVLGVAGEIIDPDGVVWSLLEAMDGTRRPDEVAAKAHERHSHVKLADLRDAVDQLVTTGYVEEAAPPPSALTEGQRDRYSRSTAFYGFVDRRSRQSPWEPQERLAVARVAIVGLGGSGCAAAYALAASGVGQMMLVDDDEVALSNLNRQCLYTEADIGLPKVEVAGRRLGALRSDLELEIRRSRVCGVQDLRQILNGLNVFLLCADSPGEIPSWVNRAAQSTGTPWVYGGYDGPHVTVSLFLPGQGPCFECAQAAYADPSSTWERLPHPPGQFAPVTATTAGLSGLLMAHVAIAHLAGVGEPKPGHAHVWNMARIGHAYTAEPDRRADCPACGSSHDR